MPNPSKRIYHNADGEIVPYDGSPLSWRVSAYVLIVKDGKLLIIKNKREKLYDIPGGGIEFGEKIEEALQREGREEAGAQFILGKLLHAQVDWFYHRENNFHQTLQLFYLADVVGELAQPTEKDIEWVNFVPLNEINTYQLPRTVQKVIEKYIVAEK